MLLNVFAGFELAVAELWILVEMTTPFDNFWLNGIRLFGDNLLGILRV